MFPCRLHLLGDKVRRPLVSVLKGAAENFTKDGIVGLFHPLQRVAAGLPRGQISVAAGTCKETTTIGKKSDSTAGKSVKIVHELSRTARRMLRSNTPILAQVNHL
jgi:hypothetical protein